MRQSKNSKLAHCAMNFSSRMAVWFLLAFIWGSHLAQASSLKTANTNFIPQPPDSGAGQPFYQPAGADRTRIPFELIDNRPVFRVRLNESDKVFRFVLDTGSHMTQISVKTASRLNLSSRASGEQATGVGGKFDVVYTLLRSCEIGKVRLENVPVLIQPLLNESYPVDGYIGLSFISRFVTSVDYGARTLTLERRVHDDRRDGPDDFHGADIPIRTTSSGIVIADVRIEGIDSPLNFIMDTGATVSVVASGMEAFTGISSCKHSSTMRIVGAAGTEENVTTILLPRLNVGASQRQNILAAVLDLEQISEAIGSQQMGIVGGDFLRHFRVVLDLPRSVVRLLPLSAEAMISSRTSESNR
jgi:predicted aspartyl protease